MLIPLLAGGIIAAATSSTPSAAAQFRLTAPCSLTPTAGSQSVAASQPTECLFVGDHLRAALFQPDSEKPHPRVVLFEWDTTTSRPRAAKALKLPAPKTGEQAAAFARIDAATWAWVRSQMGADAPERVPAVSPGPPVGTSSNGPEMPTATAQVSVRYQYDFMGRVVMKIGNDGVRQYIYEPGTTRVRAEYDEHNNMVARYEWDRDRIISVERPLEGRRLYYAYDGLGSVVALTDDSGSVVARYKYDAWGVLQQPQAPDDSNRVTFTGHRFEPETGLYNANARMYDPTTGRFITMDTVPVNPLDPATLNRYAYANDNPTRYTDPTGHYSEPGHYYTVLLAATAVGYSPREAQQLAFFAQLPDETTKLDAIAVKVSAELSRGTRATSDTVQTTFHSLTGSASARETAATLQAIRDAGDDRAVTGLLLHRLGDSFAHRQIKDESTTYETGLGHFRDGHAPDTILKRPGLYLEYVQTLVGALAEKKGLSEQERIAALAKVTPFGIQPNALPVLFRRGEAGELQPEVRKLVERHLGYGEEPPLPGEVHQVDDCLGSNACLERVVLGQLKNEAGRFGAPLDYAPETTGVGYGAMVKSNKPVATVVEEFRSATGGRGAGYDPQQIDDAARRAEELIRRRAAEGR